jgi:hypothetical protein
VHAIKQIDNFLRLKKFIFKYQSQKQNFALILVR